MFKRLFSYVWNRKGLFFLGSFFILINSVATLAPAELGGDIVKTFTAKGQQLIKNKESAQLILFGIILLAIFVVKFVADFMRRFIMPYMGQLISTDMQREFHKKVLRLPVKYFKNREIGELISRTTNDISVVKGFLGANLISIINDPLILILGIARLISINWIFTLELFLVGVLIAFLMKKTGDFLRRMAQKVQESLGDITARLQRSLFSIEIIKLFHREKYHDDNFNGAIDTYNHNAKKVIRTNALFRPSVDFLGFLAALIILTTGVFFIHDRSMTIDELFRFLLYMLILSSPLNASTSFFIQYKSASASAERIFEVLDEKEEAYNENKKPLPLITGKVEFKDVQFSYNRGAPVLNGISFTAKPGQVIAIVGSSGGGKTTLVNLIPRLIDVKKGNILIDDVNIKNVTLQSLRTQIGMVTQENILFPGTVLENILYGRLDATKEDVISAAKEANAHDFIMSFPKKYNTQIGERGVLISGGQRQRLALSRVMLKRPKIMILDEATSALDTESEKLVQDALSNILHLQTTFVIAHRLSTIMEADKILVLDKGKIKEHGTHQQLIKRKGSLYKKLYEMQFQV